MNMMISILAEAAPDPLISGNWIIMVIGAVFTGLAHVVGKKQGRAEAQENQVTLKKPIPTLTTRSEALFATKPELDDHVRWARAEFERVWGQFGTERTIDSDELNKIHERINQQSQATANLRGSVEEIGKNVTQLLHLALHGKTPPNRRQ